MGKPVTITHQAGHVSLNAVHTASLKKEDFLKSNLRESCKAEYKDDDKTDKVMSDAWDACVALVKDAPAEEVVATPETTATKAAVEPFKNSLQKEKEAKTATSDADKATT